MLVAISAGCGLRQRFRHRLAANWRNHLEDYLECYHCPVAHPGLSSVLDVSPDGYRLTATAHRLSHPGAAAARAASSGRPTPPPGAPPPCS